MSEPQYFVVTDIEGIAGIDSFDRTRTRVDSRTVRLTTRTVRLTSDDVAALPM